MASMIKTCRPACFKNNLIRNKSTTWGEGKGKADIDVKLGGNQIEYEDEDPIVPQMFQEACAKAGVPNLMEKHFKESG